MDADDGRADKEVYVQTFTAIAVALRQNKMEAFSIAFLSNASTAWICNSQVWMMN